MPARGSAHPAALAPAVQLDGVSKLYPGGQDRALADVTVRIERGEFVFVVGPSGSGKSTLLRLLLREQLVSAGQVRVLGRRVDRLPAWQVPALRQQIGAVFQDFRLLGDRTVAGNVSFALEALQVPRAVRRRRVVEALELVGLHQRRHARPDELSGGQQQRVAFARALVTRPQLLLADEPTGNLDPANTELMMRLLAVIGATGTTVIVASHNRSVVDQMQRRVLTLTGGRLTGDHQGSYRADV